MDRLGPALTALQGAKADCRRLLRARLANMSDQQRRLESAVICERVLALESYRAGGALLLYRPMLTEVDITALWNHARSAGRAIYFPRSQGEDRTLVFVRVRSGTRWRAGPLPFLEPLSEERLSHEDAVGAVIVVPGLGFSMAGCRIGRGGGFYDRSLAVPPLSRAYRIGVAFDEQLLDSLPTGVSDVSMHAVVSPRATCFSDLTASSAHVI